jgi:hypothetical protein
MEPTTTETFLQTAQVVLAALRDDRVGQAWHQESVLEHQRVGGLAGHLARGGVWVVDDYLGSSALPEERVRSAAEYFARVTELSTPEAEREVRERGAQVAEQGQESLCATLEARLGALTERLAVVGQDRHLGVAGGTLTIPLAEYLKTRIVEQVVHLDDLARSVNHDPWPVTGEAQHLVIHLGVDIGIQRHGTDAMIRCLYRSGFGSVLPVV